MDSVDRVKNFLNIFNTLDKHLDIVLETNKFMPFNEKIKTLYHGDYILSTYVKLHKAVLKYLGELRNQLVHSQKIQGKYRMVPTAKALQTLQHHQKMICSPQTCAELFHQEVHILQNTVDILSLPALLGQIYLDTQQTHIPVYQDQNFLGVSDLYQVSGLFFHKDISSQSITDLLSHNYSFVENSASIYTLEGIFYQHYQQYNASGVIFITANGKKTEKITGYILADHLPLITKQLL